MARRIAPGRKTEKGGNEGWQEYDLTVRGLCRESNCELSAFEGVASVMHSRQTVCALFETQAAQLLRTCSKWMLLEYESSREQREEPVIEH